MFFHRKKSEGPEDYDHENLRPVIRCSICTGEEVAGFRNLHSGKFTEVQLLRCGEDLQDFMARYGLKETPPREY